MEVEVAKRMPSSSRTASFTLGTAIDASEGSFSSTKTKLMWLDREDCTFYTPCYQEENVYKLIELLLENELSPHLDEFYVVYISNHAKQTRLWCQKDASASKMSSGEVLLDYHVVLLQSTHVAAAPQPNSHEPRMGAGPTYVYDLDCLLAFPTRLVVYAQHALRAKFMNNVDAHKKRMYRVVPAALYLQHFASDRSHLPRHKDEGWVLPRNEPLHSCIVTPDGRRNTLSHYLHMLPSPLSSIRERDMTAREAALYRDEQQYGEVLGEEEFLQRFGATAAL